MNTTKRKAVADDASLPKKSRRSLRGKSEFVSVEVGMREFKKRLAASGPRDATAATTAQAVEDLTQDIKTGRNRKASTRTSVSKASTKKETGRSKRVTRSTAKAAASKMTLTQVKQQLEREQKERVEQRIQTMRHKVEPIAAASSTAAAAMKASVSTPEMPSIAREVPQSFVNNVAFEASTAQSQSSKSSQVERQIVDLNAIIKTNDRTSPAEKNASTHPSSTQSKNEFIADDTEEDLLYALALEEVEKQLPAFQESATCTQSAATAKPNVVAPVSYHEPGMAAQPESHPPEQPKSNNVDIENDPHVMATVLDAEQKKAVAPELIEEMERLRRENALLRRSNELLQAATTSPAQAKVAENDQYMDTKGLDVTSKDGSSVVSVNASTARFLDLTRCNSDQDTMISYRKDLDQVANDHLLKKNRSPSKQPDDAMMFLCSLEKEKRLEDKQNHEESKAIAIEANTTSESTSRTGLTLLPGHAALNIENEHAATEQKLDQVKEPSIHETPSSLSSNKGDVNHDIPTNDDGNVSDDNMSDISNEKSADDQEDAGIERTSTIDCGNYAEYKLQCESESDIDEDEDLERTSDHTIAAQPSSDVIDRIQKPNSIAISGFVRQTTPPSGFDDKKDAIKDKMADVKQQPDVLKPDSSSSECESESDAEDDAASHHSSNNALEAALKAAEASSNRESLSSSSSSIKPATTDKQGVRKDDSFQAISKPIRRKRKSPSSMATNVKKPSNGKNSLLWPALDEFYDYLLDLSPSNVHGRDQKASLHLRPYARGKLPAQYSSLDDYCGVQFDAIKEELMASIQNSMDQKRMESVGSIQSLSLTSVSSCGVQKGFVSSTGLSFGELFSESGFSGNLRHQNDHILIFDTPRQGTNGAVDLSSGDLVLLQSPRWKKYDVSGFGVILCDSEGRKHVGGAHGRSQQPLDQICVLFRVPKAHEEEAHEAATFETLTELCLSNQQALKWNWSLQFVHNTTTSAREFQAIKSISFFPPPLQQMLLQGRFTVPSRTREQKFHHPSQPSTSILSPRLLKYLQQRYNESQLKAILACLGETKSVIIQGPPGTGKTKTILGLLSALLDGAGQQAKGTATRIQVGASLQTSAVSKSVSIRLLVAAPSNAAVDELVLRVLTEGLYDGEKGQVYRPRIVRVGRPESRVQGSRGVEARDNTIRKHTRKVEEVLLETLVMKHRRSFSTLKQAREAMIKNAQIVFCTLSGAGSVAMCEVTQEFDALVIDEAAQAVEASTLIPFKFRPPRIVLVGDHRQLPATVLSKQLEAIGYDRSFLQRLVENHSPVVLLTQQYRMHPDIASFPSTYFYGGRLVQEEKMRVSTAQEYHADAAFKPLVFYNVHGRQSQVRGSTSLRNMNEVDVVIQLVRRLLDRFPQFEWQNRIGIMAPYKQQIYHLRDAIRKLERDVARPLGIEISTVDGFQGREKEIIIYSCVRTCDRTKQRRKQKKKKKKEKEKEKEEKDEKGVEAFWADERRMNVALTRAKSSLWIVGNSTLLSQSRPWRDFIQHTKDRNRFITDSAAFLLNRDT